jgi:ketosteroid isomerase-like protein
MGEPQSSAEDEAAIRGLIESWVGAVRRRDIEAILKNHSPDLVMFDVPPPFEIHGLEAYRKSWDLFYSWSDEPIPFDIHTLNISAGADVAFAVATMGCAEPAADGRAKPLDFRLTIGLRKIDGYWIVTHEHHSVPAID